MPLLPVHQPLPQSSLSCNPLKTVTKATLEYESADSFDTVSPWLQPIRSLRVACVYLLNAADGHRVLQASALPLFGQLVVNLSCAEDQPLHGLWTLGRHAHLRDQPLEVSSCSEEEEVEEKGKAWKKDKDEQKEKTKKRRMNEKKGEREGSGSVRQSR